MPNNRFDDEHLRYAASTLCRINAMPYQRYATSTLGRIAMPHHLATESQNVFNRLVQSVEQSFGSKNKCNSPQSHDLIVKTADNE